MEPEAGGWRRSAVARYHAARYAGSPEEDAQGGSKPIEALPPAHRPVMDAPGGGAGSDDFVGLLRRLGHIPQVAAVGPTTSRTDVPQTHATTILAFKFQGGVLVAG